jgi:hypothetical protein
MFQTFLSIYPDAYRTDSHDGQKHGVDGRPIRSLWRSRNSSGLSIVRQSDTNQLCVDATYPYPHGFQSYRWPNSTNRYRGVKK